MHTGTAGRGYALAPGELRDWLMDPPGVSVSGQLYAVAEQVAILNGTHGGDRDLGKLMASFQATATRLVCAACTELRTASHPLDGEYRLLARSADFLLHELARGHERLVRLQSDRVFVLGLRRRIASHLLAAVGCLAQRLSIANLIHADPPKGTWEELHRLYGLARASSLQRVPVGRDCVEAAYCRALLTSFADPRRMQPDDLACVEALLAEHASANCRITGALPGGGTMGQFLVTAGHDAPGRPIARGASTILPKDLVLDCSRLVEALMRQASTARLQGAMTRDLAESLVRHWGAMTSRKFRRLRSFARVELVVGVGPISARLGAPDGQGTGAPSSKWMVVNESARGYALMHVSGPCVALRVGDVVGMFDGRDCRVCLIRWILSNDAEHLEVGVEELSASPAPVSMSLPGAGIGRECPALMLPAIERLGQPAMVLSQAGGAATGLRPGELVAQTATVRMFRVASKP